MQSYVYIMANKYHGTLYVGLTTDLAKRVGEHKNRLADGATNKYSVHHLVYFEAFDDIEEAIDREKQMRAWSREQKEAAVVKENPAWKDLYEEII